MSENEGGARTRQTEIDVGLERATSGSGSGCCVGLNIQQRYLFALQTIDKYWVNIALEAPNSFPYYFGPAYLGPHFFRSPFGWHAIIQPSEHLSLTPVAHFHILY